MFTLEAVFGCHWLILKRIDWKERKNKEQFIEILENSSNPIQNTNNFETYLWT
jgi:hypothetical protein